MTVDGLREICLALPGVAEDVKWGQDLCFCVGGKMFVVVNLEPPHQMSFKCTPEGFAELIEREGIIPAPYLARAMWVQESELGAVLERRELERLLRASYELVRAKLPKSKRMPAAAAAGNRKRSAKASPRLRSGQAVERPPRARKRSR